MKAKNNDSDNIMTDGDMGDVDTGEAIKGDGILAHDETEATLSGFTSLAKMPTVGGFFTRASKHGQP